MHGRHYRGQSIRLSLTTAGGNAGGSLYDPAGGNAGRFFGQAAFHLWEPVRDLFRPSGESSSSRTRRVSSALL
jgi:hypothetical protein